MANRARDVIKTVRRDYSKNDIKNERIERYHRELKEANEYFEQEKEALIHTLTTEINEHIGINSRINKESDKNRPAGS